MNDNESALQQIDAGKREVVVQEMSGDQLCAMLLLAACKRCDECITNLFKLPGSTEAWMDLRVARDFARDAVEKYEALEA